MGLADVPFTIQIRNRPCHFQHPLASAGGQAELLGDKGWLPTSQAVPPAGVPVQGTLEVSTASRPPPGARGEPGGAPIDAKLSRDCQPSTRFLSFSSAPL